MILLEKLNMREVITKTGKIYKRRFGLFLCEYCKMPYQMRLDNGLKVDSCGCNQTKAISEANRTHGDTVGYKKEKLYSVWQNMIRRCYNPDFPGYEWYGGRGIQVMKLWRENYIFFKRWALKNGYREGLTIDRVKNDGNYSNQNCRWVTQKINNKNRRPPKKFGDRLTCRKIRSLR